MKKIFINPCWIHPKNKEGLNKILEYLNFEIVNSIENAEIIYSSSEPIKIENYKDKKFIFGPHFSVFPDSKAYSLNNLHKNAIYIQPSQPSVDTWTNEFNYTNVPVKSFPFPVDLQDINNIKNKNKILLYCKQRFKEDIDFIKNKLINYGISFEVINYGSYIEEDYQKLLNETKYIVWVGCHESQGFALQSALAKNIPLFVWSVTKRTQQLNCSQDFFSKGFTKVSTIPYWDNRCGEYFINSNEFDDKFNLFLKNIDYYTPREYINSNLSLEACSQKFINLIKDI